MPSISVPVERQVRPGRKVEDGLSPLARAVNLIANRIAPPGFAADHCAATLLQPTR